MKKIICALLFSLLMASWACADVAINAENFPDDAFRAYVSKNFDTDSNGVLSDAEIAGVTEISNIPSRTSSLQGVKYFTALTSLDCCTAELTELDMNGCTSLRALWCNDNQITHLM